MRQIPYKGDKTNEVYINGVWWPVYIDLFVYIGEIMSVARTHHTKDFTVMSNYHFKDKSISLKAKGLLSLMLSLSDTWDYSVAGLASLSSDGETSVRTAVKELEEHNYLKRTPVRENGRIIDWEYDIYEKPLEILEVEIPQVETPLLENTDNKILKQLNTKKENTKVLLSKDNNTTNFQFGGTKQRKDNLYTRCVSMIVYYTSDQELVHTLVDYLKVRLEMKDKPLYANSWKGLLNKLDRDFEPEERLAVVRQSIERGYASFFPVGSNNYDVRKGKPWEEGVRSTRYTEEELKELEELDRQREAQGLRTKF